MPILSGTRDVRGTTGYVYDISGDDIDMLAQEMLANADAPFTFIGRIDGKQQNLSDPRHVGMTLARNGQVAATANVAGETVKIQLVGTSMNIIPESGIQSTADMLVGAGSMGYADDDDFDPFASAGESFPVPDPRARSQELADRYGDDEEDYYLTEEIYQPAVASDASKGDVVGVGEWLLTVIILLIPVVNLVALIIWLVSKKTKQSKKNYLKVQIIFWIIALLLSAFTVVTALQMGVVDALIAQQMGQTSAASQMYDEEDEDYDNMNLDRRGNSNENENENGNANANSNLNANAVPSNTVPETPAASELRQSTNGTINTDNIARATLPDGRSVAIVTLTAFNTTDMEAPASALFEFLGNQGQNSLEFNFEAVGGFDPSSVNMPIVAGAAGTFQVSFLLVDDQELTVHVISRLTNETVLEASQLVR